MHAIKETKREEREREKGEREREREERERAPSGVTSRFAMPYEINGE